MSLSPLTPPAKPSGPLSGLSRFVGSFRWAFMPVGLLALIAVACLVLARLCRRGRVSARAVRLAIGYSLIGNELIWWSFRYSHEGIHLRNLPFQRIRQTNHIFPGGTTI